LIGKGYGKKTNPSKTMFEDQDEYDSFMAWAIEGSCLAQRMNACEGGGFDIPSHWVAHKEDAKKRLLPSELPKRLRKNA
jgi:hypothetical protein